MVCGVPDRVHLAGVRERASSAGRSLARCLVEPAPIQTCSWVSSDRSRTTSFPPAVGTVLQRPGRTRSQPGRGRAGDLARATPAPPRPSPGRRGDRRHEYDHRSPSQSQTSDLTICASSAPAERAASSAVSVSWSNSSSRASACAARRKSATRWTGSGHTAKTYRRALFWRDASEPVDGRNDPRAAT